MKIFRLFTIVPHLKIKTNYEIISRYFNITTYDSIRIL